MQKIKIVLGILSLAVALLLAAGVQKASASGGAWDFEGKSPVVQQILQASVVATTEQGCDTQFLTDAIHTAVVTYPEKSDWLEELTASAELLPGPSAECLAIALNNLELIVRQ